MSIGGLRAAALALCFLLPACGTTHSPAEVNIPLPVTFYGGHVLSVQQAAIGFPDGNVMLSVSPNFGWPGVGIAAGDGREPGGVAGTLTAGVTNLNLEAAAANVPGLEYTIAVDGTRQNVQITQYASVGEYVIPPGQSVVIRVVGKKGRVYPLALVPPGYQNRIARGEIPLPLGAPLLAAANLAAPPIGMNCGARMPDQVVTCSEIAPPPSGYRHGW